MSALKAFLQPSVTGQTREVIVSERFKGENGLPVPFVIQAIAQEENEALSRMSKKKEFVKGRPVETLNASLYTKRLILACVVDPDLKSEEICKYYKTEDPLEVAGKMLSIGEFGILSDAIQDINGMNEAQEKLDEAKNS